MNEFLVNLPFWAISLYSFVWFVRCDRFSSCVFFALLTIAGAAIPVGININIRDVPPNAQALQNAHAAIIGKLRAELDECREEK